MFFYFAQRTAWLQIFSAVGRAQFEWDEAEEQVCVHFAQHAAWLQNLSAAGRAQFERDEAEEQVSFSLSKQCRVTYAS